MKFYTVEFKTPDVITEFLLEGLVISVDLTPAIRYQKIEDCTERDNCASPKLMAFVKNHWSVLLVGNREIESPILVSESQ